VISAQRTRTVHAKLGPRLAAGALLAASVAAAAAGEGPALQSLAADLAAAEAAPARVLAHQLRSADAMWALVGQLPAEARPDRIAYVASGAHLAPLVLCQALPDGAPCELVFTDIDPSVREDLDSALAQLAERGVVAGLRRPDEAGGPWSFRLAGHPVRLALLLPQAPAGGGRPPLFSPELLADADLVISHDWSGDPLGNLRLIHSFLEAARRLDGPLPQLMIEDLERHPYPIDLGLFGPVARTTLPYGHRTSDEGVGRHGTVELGQPLFGGGVILSFGPRWWRSCDHTTLEGVLDFLLFNEFNDLRQNVLEGGDDPLLSPALLDWWTGYGERSLAGDDRRVCLTARRAMLTALTTAAPHLAPALRRRMGCRLQLLNALLETRAAGGNVNALMPSARHTRRPQAGHFPSPAMERLYTEALSNVQAYQLAASAEREVASSLLQATRTPVLEALASACPADPPNPETADAAAWAGAYRALAAAVTELP